MDALAAAHEWGENGQSRPVSKVANKVGRRFLMKKQFILKKKGFIYIFIFPYLK